MALHSTRTANLMKSFGKAVREARVRLGLSQEALADRAALDRSYMSQIERGIKNATLNSVWRIASALGIAPSSLIGDVEQRLVAMTDSDDQDQRVAGEGGRGAHGATAASRRALVVDDDVDVCFAIESLLQDAGFETRQAHSGMEALRLITEKPVHVVISDIRMGAGSGLDLLNAIRQMNRKLPVFLVTGYDDLSREDAARRGASGIFSKPFDSRAFVSAVTSALD